MTCPTGSIRGRPEPIRDGPVMHMKNTCSPTSRDVKISTSNGWTYEWSGARQAGGRPDRIVPEVAAQTLYGAPAAVVAGPPGPRRAPCAGPSRRNSYAYPDTGASNGCGGAD